MLKARVLTAAVLIPLVLFIIFYLPFPIFAGITGLFFLLAIFEWTRLAGFDTWWGRLIAAFGILAIFLAFLLIITYFTQDKFLLYQLHPETGEKLYRSEVLQRIFMIVIFGGWLLAGAAVVFFPRGKQFYAPKIAGLIIGAFVLLPPFVFLLALQKMNPQLVLYVLLLIWAADIGAYFAGKFWGKHKLAPNVSPGKTWEGVAGALLASLLVAIAGFFLFKIQLAFGIWILFNLVIVIFSIIGDLFESLFKRMRNLKDSGRLFPGHGGILDRIDSLTSAVPIFALGLMSLA